MKPIWIVLISVVVTGGLIGGGTYYLMNKQANDDKASLQTQINDLSQKFADSETALAAATKTPAATSTVTPTATTAPTAQSTTPTPPTNNAVAGTENWLTYSNNTLGFSVKYPSDWTVNKYSDIAGEASFNDAEQHWQVNISEKATTLTLKQNASTELARLQKISKVVASDTTLGGVAAKKYINASVSDEYLVVNNGKLYTILFFGSLNTDANYSSMMQTLSFL